MCVVRTMSRTHPDDIAIVSLLRLLLLLLLLSTSGLGYNCIVGKTQEYCDGSQRPLGSRGKLLRQINSSPSPPALMHGQDKTDESHVTSKVCAALQVADICNETCSVRMIPRFSDAVAIRDMAFPHCICHPVADERLFRNQKQRAFSPSYRGVPWSFRYRDPSAQVVLWQFMYLLKYVCTRCVWNMHGILTCLLLPPATSHRPPEANMQIRTCRHARACVFV